MATEAYTMRNVTVMVDGQRVTGFWDGDDAVTIEPASEAGTMMHGADGSSLFSQHANEGVTVTLRLQHTSPTHRLLRQRMARQRVPGFRVVGFPLVVTDVDSGEGGSTDTAFIVGEPTDSKGTAATPREWVLAVGRWTRNIPHA